MAESHSVKRAGKAPISTHPAFPAIVALWFACLLGLGSLVLPVVLFENLIAVSGITAFVPAASPPLGLTARAVIALTGALIGGAAGLLLARQVARSHAPKPTPLDLDQGNARRRRPIAAHDELGEEGLGWPEPKSAGRVRRSLLADDDSQHIEYEMEGPVEAANEDPDIPADAERTPEEDWQMEHASLADAGPQTTDEACGFAEDLGAPIGDESPRLRTFGAGAEFSAAQLSSQDHTVAEWRSPQPVSGNAHAAKAEADTVDGNWDVGEPSTPQMMVVESSRGDLEVRQPLCDRPLDELGLVQLAGRLGAAIENRRALKAHRSPTAPAGLSPDAPAGFEAAEAEDAARAMAEFFGPGEPGDGPGVSEPERPYHAAPAAMRTLQIEEDYEDDEDPFAGSFSLPPRGLSSAHGLSAGAPIDDDDGTDEGECDQSEYSSLLTMKNPFSRPQEFVRGDETETEVGDLEPAVTSSAATTATAFETPAAPAWDAAAAKPSQPAELRENSTDSAAPAAAPQYPDGAEQHLRSVLATLQRINGAA